MKHQICVLGNALTGVGFWGLTLLPASDNFSYPILMSDPMMLYHCILTSGASNTDIYQIQERDEKWIYSPLNTQMLEMKLFEVVDKKEPQRLLEKGRYSE